MNVFGLSIAILVNIIMPKILRVLSGEKVVLTHLLTRYNQPMGALADDPSTENYQGILRKSSSKTVGGGRRSTMFSPGEIVKLNRDDPLPRKLESGIYDVHSMLGQISRLWCVKGKTALFLVLSLSLS